MNTCGRCRSIYSGVGRVCPACSGRDLSPGELQAVNAGATEESGLAFTPGEVERPSSLAFRTTPLPRRQGTLEAALRATSPTTPLRRLQAGTQPDALGETDPLLGQTPLGQFRILKKLGEGGFGAVYLAEQLAVGRKAVIKVLRSGLAGSAQFVQRFRREAAVLAALDHHHLVRLYNFGALDDGQLFLAMEHGGDRTLAEEIRRAGRFTEARALRIAAQVAQALHEAHARGVVHRDLKPANIMLGEKEGQDWIKVVDVGIAKLLEESQVYDGQSRLTDTGGIIGTPAYFSPEQAQGVRLDGRSDVYALGCVLYEMLSGKLPIEGKSPIDFARAHCVEPPTPLRDVGARVSPALEAVLVKKLLCKDREKRMTAAQVAEWAADAMRFAEAQPNRKPRRARWPLPLAAAVAGLAVAAGWIWRERPYASAPPAPAAFPAPAFAQPSPEKIRHAELSEELHPLLAPEEAASSTPAGDPWAAKVAKIEALAKANRSSEVISQAGALLADGPPDEVKYRLYRSVGNAEFQDGHSREALRFLQLYRARAPQDELPELDARLGELRSELNLGSPKGSAK